MDLLEITQDQYNYLKSQLSYSVYSESWLLSNYRVVS